MPQPNSVGAFYFVAQKTLGSWRRPTAMIRAAGDHPSGSVRLSKPAAQVCRQASK
ncbi:hypothetical protein [Zhongshania aliphaticivorans]|uniref:hypothetical protein n=1 Tax=Zhongshania aliphaticivorans TaxID=1470434 RepID=UPI0013306D0F|nr:hypothetical protein [Zhongshania aliphaticivorans]